MSDTPENAPRSAGARVPFAIAIIMAAIFLLDMMGVFIRMLSEAYPPSQLAAFRNLFGLVPPALVLLASADWHASGRKLGMRQWRLALFRGVFVAVAQLCYYLALVRLEFATASTLAFAGPMIVVALSVPILRERVGPWRWTAVLTGFAGVIWVMRPGSDIFTVAALLPIGAAAGYAISSVTVRLIDGSEPSAKVNLYSTLAAMICALALTLALEQPVAVASWRDLAMIVAMGACGGTGVLFLIIAYRMVQPAILAPFEYTGIAFAFVLGWVFFDEAPFERLFPGVLLIVGAGLIIVWRESVTAAPRHGGDGLPGAAGATERGKK